MELMIKSIVSYGGDNNIIDAALDMIESIINLICEQKIDSYNNIG